MRRVAGLATGLLLAGVVLAMPLTASAENIEVDPGTPPTVTVDFEDVDVGDQRALTFIITGAGAVFDSVMGAIDISHDAAGAYSVLSAPPPETEIAPGETVDLVVEFAPVAAGPHSATLNIASSDLRWPDLEILLVGNGVDDPGDDPLDMIDAALAFFDASIADGTLSGTGRCRAARAHARIVRRHIARAGERLAIGEEDAACARLRAAYLRSDGARRPRDFVAGPAAGELAVMLADIRDVLECP